MSGRLCDKYKWLLRLKKEADEKEENLKIHLTFGKSLAFGEGGAIHHAS